MRNVLTHKHIILQTLPSVNLKRYRIIEHIADVGIEAEGSNGVRDEKGVERAIREDR